MIVLCKQFASLKKCQFLSQHDQSPNREIRHKVNIKKRTGIDRSVPGCYCCNNELLRREKNCINHMDHTIGCFNIGDDDHGVINHDAAIYHGNANFCALNRGD